MVVVMIILPPLQTTADAIKNSFLSQINGATHTFKDGVGVTASNRGAGSTNSSSMGDC